MLTYAEKQKKPPSRNDWNSPCCAAKVWTLATELANRFNLHYKDVMPVPTQTAHKWLNGRSIPASNKLATLTK